MNAATRVMVQGSIFRGSLRRIVLSREIVALLVLAVSVFVSAFLIVYVKDLQRRLVSQLEVATQVNDRLHMEWSQLLLEQSTWSKQSRVQKMAIEQLKMELPTAKQVKVLDE